MKKLTLLCVSALFSYALTAQNEQIAWSSDAEDTTDFGFEDHDGDSNNWSSTTDIAFFTPEDMGLSGKAFYSASWFDDGSDDGVELTPDNRLRTPGVNIPNDASVIIFKMKYSAASDYFFDEKFSIYAYDVNSNFDLESSQAIATVNVEEPEIDEDDNLVDIEYSVNLPANLIGKTVSVVIRHQLQDINGAAGDGLVIDDLEILHDGTLSVDELNIKGIFPNPTTGIITIDSDVIAETVNVVNIVGQTVLSINNVYNNTVDLSSLESGIYFVTVSSEGKSSTVKINKK